MHHAYQLILVFLLSVALRVAAQVETPALLLYGPVTILECTNVTFTWEGGLPNYQFSWGSGAPGDSSVSPSWGSPITDITGLEITQYFGAGVGWLQFTVQDSTNQTSTLWYDIQQNRCTVPHTVAPWYPPSDPPTEGGTLSSSPTAPYPYPPPSTSVILSGVPPVATTPASTTTVKTAHGPLFPTPANPSNPAESNPSSPTNPTGGGGSGPGGSPESGSAPGSSPSGSDGSGDPAGGNASSGGNYPTSRQGTNGQIPTQTASPLRNTVDDEAPKAGMSSQTIGTIIGTIVGAFVIFLAFFCFRWRQRHQRKHQPMAILPGVGSSGDDLTTAVIPVVYDNAPSMRQSSYYGAAFAQSLAAPARVLPSSKQAQVFGPRRSYSSSRSDSTPPSLSAETWHSHGETSRLDSQSAYPEDEEVPVASTSYVEQNVQLAPAQRVRSPLSLQQLIGRELDNILSSPETYSPDSPPYTPSSLYGRDPRSGFRIANATEASSSAGGAFASSSSKRPLETSSSHSHSRRAETPDASAGSAEGGGRPRVAISRNEMEYLADLVAARITRGNLDQRTEQTRTDIVGRQRGHGPPPSYV